MKPPFARIATYVLLKRIRRPIARATPVGPFGIRRLQHFLGDIVFSPAEVSIQRSSREGVEGLEIQDCDFAVNALYPNLVLVIGQEHFDAVSNCLLVEVGNA